MDDLSFTLPAGGSLGIVGESGSGKTTTAGIVVGHDRADAGEVLVGGRARTGGARGRRERGDRDRAAGRRGLAIGALFRLGAGVRLGTFRTDGSGAGAARRGVSGNPVTGRADRRAVPP
ncbi:hypothetical protein VM98_35260, partial [Streptomyces rubellomurinus subsp. indigoferus]